MSFCASSVAKLSVLATDLWVWYLNGCVEFTPGKMIPKNGVRNFRVEFDYGAMCSDPILVCATESTEVHRTS